MTDQDNIIKKINKLHHRIRVWSYGNSNKNDFLWCDRLLKDVENGIIPPKIDLLAANQIWKKYKV